MRIPDAQSLVPESCFHLRPPPVPIDSVPMLSSSISSTWAKTGATCFRTSNQPIKTSDISLRARQFHSSSASCNRKCGIVGLPNVGKSSLFNALVGREAAQSSNRPFTTIEPNSSIVRVPDERLKALAVEAESAKITEATVDFIDIAGLVAGASEGKGLGNKFLANIASVHSIVHVVRCFEDDSITHVEGTPDPIRDIQIIEKELIYKDLSSMEGFHRRRPKGNNTEAKVWESTHAKTMALLEEEKPALGVKNSLTEDETALFETWRLLSAKPILIACNVDENSVSKGNALSQVVKEWASAHSHSIAPVVVSAKLESELMILEDDPVKRMELFMSYGMEESALTQIIRSSYQLLDLITFYTVGPTESRAWSVRKGSTAKECAAEIHTDISKGFIKAETFSYDDYITLGEKKAKEMNKLRLEGPGYIAQDGDIFLFKFKGAR